MKKRQGVWILGCLVVWAATSFAAAPYTVTDLGTLGGEMSEPYAINSSGQIVGWAETSEGHTHAFLWDKDTMLDLETLAEFSSYSIAQDINDYGKVVGFSEVSSGDIHHAFFWDNASGMQDLGIAGEERTAAKAINNSDQVVGVYGAYKMGYPHMNDYNSFVWEKETGIRPFMGVSGNNSPRAINEHGQIVLNTGGSVWAWEKGEEARRLCTGKAVDINDSGEILLRRYKSGPWEGHLVDFRSGEEKRVPVSGSRMNNLGQIIINSTPWVLMVLVYGPAGLLRIWYLIIRDGDS